MFDPVRLPSKSEEVDRLLNAVIAESRATKDNLAFVVHSLEKTQKKLSEAIKSAPTVSEYFQILWDATDLKEKAREFVVEKLAEKDDKNQEAVVNGKIIVRENPLDIDEVILPKSKIGKYTRNRFDEKDKQLIKAFGSEKKGLSISNSNNEIADIIRYVSKPVLTTTTEQNFTQLHYNSVGTLMVGVSGEIELLQQQHAEEFVKKLHDEKEQFENKIKEMEARIEQREKDEMQRFREHEEQKELLRLRKKKEELAKNLKEIKARNEERIKAKEVWMKTYKALKQKKPRYVKIQEEYEEEEEKKHKEEESKRLKELQDLHRIMTKEELDEHEKNFLKHLETAKAKQNSLKPLKTITTTPVNLRLARILSMEKAKSQEALEERKRNRERVENLNQKVQKHRVNVDPVKEEEMKQLIQKLQDENRSKRSTKGDDPAREPNENELNMQRTKKLQNLVIAKSLRKYETINDEIEAKKGISQLDSSQSPAYYNYWKDVKKELHIEAHPDNWKNIVSSKELSKIDKTTAILIEASKLEEKAKMKEKLWKAKRGNPDNFKDYIEESEQVDDYYINSIKAKLALLSSKKVETEPARTSHKKAYLTSNKSKKISSNNLQTSNTYDNTTQETEDGPQAQTNYRSHNYADSYNNIESDKGRPDI